MTTRNKRLAILGAVAAVLLLGMWFFRMPAPELDNLTRPTLTLGAIEGQTAGDSAVRPVRSAPAVRPGAGDAPKRIRAIERPNGVRKTAAERREAIRKRREARLQRRRDGGGPGGVAPGAARPVRPGRIGRRSGDAGNMMPGAAMDPAEMKEGLEALEDLPLEDLEALEQMEQDSEGGGSDDQLIE